MNKVESLICSLTLCSILQHQFRLIVIKFTYDFTENILFRHPYDIIIRCLGFKVWLTITIILLLQVSYQELLSLQFDFSIFNTTTVPIRKVADGKFPGVKSNYEAIGVNDLFIGGLTEIITCPFHYRIMMMLTP